MAFFEDSDRTEPATPRKRQEAREKGQVARSQDLAAALVLLAACLALNFWGLPSLSTLGTLTANSFRALSSTPSLDIPTVVHALGAALLLGVRVLAPLALLLFAVAMVANIAQVGFLMSGHPVTPDLGRLSPGRGLARILSLRGVLRGGFGLFKILLVGSILALTLWNELAGPQTSGTPVLLWGTLPEAASSAIQLAVSMGLKAVSAFLALALLDYALQRVAHERDLRMTRSELKEELRRMEGDPKIRERRRRVQEQLRSQRMMREVPRADVVLTNPGHLAVAIRYDRPAMSAPRLVAKGEGHLAQRIREVAMENGVPVVERPPLARGLYGRVEVGKEISPDFYQAMAEVLAYVYRLAGANRKAADQPPPATFRRRPPVTSGQPSSETG